MRKTITDKIIRMVSFAKPGSKAIHLSGEFLSQWLGPFVFGLVGPLLSNRPVMLAVVWLVLTFLIALVRCRRNPGQCRPGADSTRS